MSNMTHLSAKCSAQMQHAVILMVDIPEVASQYFGRGELASLTSTSLPPPPHCTNHSQMHAHATECCWKRTCNQEEVSSQQQQDSV